MTYLARNTVKTQTLQKSSPQKDINSNINIKVKRNTYNLLLLSLGVKAFGL
jgi:hypothetical protein